MIKVKDFRAARAAAGLTQAQAAGALGVSVRTVARYDATGSPRWALMMLPGAIALPSPKYDLSQDSEAIHVGLGGHLLREGAVVSHDSDGPVESTE